MQMERVSDSNVKVIGRHMVRNDVLYIDYSASYIEFKFTGKSISARIRTDNAKEQQFIGTFAVYVDDMSQPARRYSMDGDEKDYVLFESETEKTVVIRVVKYSEAAFGKMGIVGLTHDGSIEKTAYSDRRIEFIGDSITCGYGVEGEWNEGKNTFSTATKNPDKAYAVLTSNRLGADWSLVSWSGNGIISAFIDASVDEPNDSFLMPYVYRYTDAGGSTFAGDTEPEPWDFKRFVPQVVVINLGTNDKSYTKEKPERVRRFGELYEEFYSYIRKNNPEAEIFFTLGIMGQELCPEIERVYEILRKSDKKLHYVKFPVQQSEDGIGIDWHPSGKTHIKAAELLSGEISAVTGWNRN